MRNRSYILRGIQNTGHKSNNNSYKTTNGNQSDRQRQMTKYVMLSEFIIPRRRLHAQMCEVEGLQ